MRTRLGSVTLFVTLVGFCSHVVFAQGTPQTNTISITFVTPTIVPAMELPEQARNARGSGNPTNCGALSSIVAGRIESMSITWVDTNLFKTRGEAESAVRRLLSAPSGSWISGVFCDTYEQVVWAQPLGMPSIVARVEHRDGKPGQMVLFGVGQCHFAYQDGNGKWWLGQWGEIPRR